MKALAQALAMVMQEDTIIKEWRARQKAQGASLRESVAPELKKWEDALTKKTFPYATTKVPAMYDQTYVDGLELEVKHYQRLYRAEMRRRMELEDKLREA